MDYCKKLDFIQKPDYNYLRVLLRSVATRERLDLDINCFDWCFLLGKKSKFNHDNDVMSLSKNRNEREDSKVPLNT